MGMVSLRSWIGYQSSPTKNSQTYQATRELRTWWETLSSISILTEMWHGHGQPSIMDWISIVTSREFTDLPGYPGVTNVVGDALINIDLNGNVAWAWSAFDHGLDINRHLQRIHRPTRLPGSYERGGRRSHQYRS